MSDNKKVITRMLLPGVQTARLSPRGVAWSPQSRAGAYGATVQLRTAGRTSPQRPGY